MKDTKKIAVLAAVVLLMIGATPASALLEEWEGSVSFEGDGDPNKVINLNSFDTTLGGGRALNSVLVELFHDGSADILGDNDDGSKTTLANARIVRIWSAFGPGVNGSGNHTVTSPVVTLGLDDGDGGFLDTNAPDGNDFSGLASFSDVSAGSFNPSTALYETAGSGTVGFDITPILIVNDVQFNPTPAAWQLEAQNSDLTVTAKVTYDFVYVPEPATMALLGLGSVVLRKKRRL